MGREKLRLSKRKSGKRRKLRADVAAHYEQAFHSLLQGVKPSRTTVGEAPPGVRVLRTVRKEEAPAFEARHREELLRQHMHELLAAATDYFREENVVKMCVRCREHQKALAGPAARLHHVLQKILGEKAPAPRPTSF